MLSIFPPGGVILSRASFIEVDASGTEGSYTRIQNAITDADTGDTIFVHDGIYTENVVIDKRVTVQGESKSGTIIDGGGKGNVVTINAGGAVLAGVSIRNSGAGDNAGVRFDGVSQAMITDCRLHDNQYGVRLFQADSITITENAIVNSSSTGLYIGSHCIEALIFHNNFLDNGDNAFDEGTDNQWYNATLQEGNYWDNYDGNDTDNDGIGDSNYPIPPSVSLKYDPYPLMHQYAGINILHLQAEPQIQEPGRQVNVSCRITSSAEVNHSYINITMPNGTYLNASLQREGNTSNYYYSRSYDDKGTYRYRVWANDTNNNSIRSAEKKFVVAYKPNASFRYTPSSPTRLDAVTFNGSNSSDPDGSIVNYSWSLGDGTTTFGTTVSHQYSSNDTFTVTLTVTDNHGAWGTSSRNVTIRNIPPTAGFSFSPDDPTVGETISFSENASDPDGTIVKYEWNFGDGTTTSGGDMTHPSHVYRRNGVFNVTLTVTDYDTDTDTASREITVRDVESPVIENVSAFPNPQERHGRVNISCTIIDDVAVSAASVDIDGPGVDRNASMHQVDGTATWYYTANYSSEGNYTYTVWTTDPSGNTNQSQPHTFEIIIPAEPPEIHEVREWPTTKQYGFPVNISANVTDNVRVETVSANVTLPNGGSVNRSMSPSCIDDDCNGIYFYNETYDMLGDYNYTIWATDINGYVNHSISHSFSVIDTMSPEVNNLTVTPAVQHPNETVNVSCTASDNLQVANVSIIVTHGNDTVASKEMNTSSCYYLTRNYSQRGRYNVTVTARDTRGNTASFSTHFNVTFFPTANFSYSPAVPTSQETITFNDTSTDSDGDITAWNWSFGDGNTSTVQQPRHSYSADGTYTVTLTVWDDDGATASIAKDIEIQNVPPTANFTYTPVQPTDLDAVAFNASASTDDGDITGYTWSFGDNESGNGMTASHIYPDDGTYTVTLTVTDDDGATDSCSRNVTIDNVPPVADFQYRVYESNLYIAVEDNGSRDPDGVIEAWQWSFGDGTTANGTSARHTYSEAGSYQVTLQVTDDDGATNTTSIQIPVGVFLSANFTHETDPASGEPVAFYDNSSNAAAWQWSFGDGATSNETHPSHVYPIGNYYNVTLTVTNGSKNASVSKTVPVDTCIHIVKNADNVVNYLPWLGDDITASALAGEIGSDVMPEGSVVSRWNTTRGAFDSYVVGVSPSSYDFTIHPGDCIVLRVAQSGQYQIEVNP